MAPIDPGEIGPVVRATIAEHFGAPLDEVTDETVAEDIDGWDSLAHTVLLIRIEKRVGIAVNEHIAAATSVGEMIARLRSAAVER